MDRKYDQIIRQINFTKKKTWSSSLEQKAGIGCICLIRGR